MCKCSEIYFRPQLKVCLWSIVYLKPRSAMLRLLIIDYQNQNKVNRGMSEQIIKQNAGIQKPFFTTKYAIYTF